MAAAKNMRDAIKQAEKILGAPANSKVVVPPPKNDPQKLGDTFRKSLDKFNDSLKDFEPTLLAAQNALSDYKNAMKQNAVDYQREDFSEKSKEDLKKIKDA
jgi:hypothetical protein